MSYRGSIGLPPWGHLAFHQERTITIPKDATSWKEWASVWPPDKKAQARLNKYRDTQRSHNDVDTDGSKMNERLGQQQSSTAISRMLRQPNLPTPVQKTTRQQHHLCYWGYIHHTGTELLHASAHDPPVHHDGVVSSGSMSCFQAIQGADIVSHFISHNLNLLWLLSVKFTRVRFCWIPSHCGIDGNGNETFESSLNWCNFWTSTSP